MLTIKYIRGSKQQERRVFYEDPDGKTRSLKLESMNEKEEWELWKQHWTPKVLRQVHSTQHQWLRIATEANKGFGVQVRDNQTIVEGSIFCTGTGTFLTPDADDEKREVYCSKHGVFPLTTYGLGVKQSGPGVKHENEKGTIDPSNADFQLLPNMAKECGLYWWVNEPSGNEVCNARAERIRLPSGEGYMVFLVSLRTICQNEFILIDYGYKVKRGYVPSKCANTPKNKDCEICCSMDVYFPLVKYPSKPADMLKWPDGKYIFEFPSASPPPPPPSLKSDASSRSKSDDTSSSDIFENLSDLVDIDCASSVASSIPVNDHVLPVHRTYSVAFRNIDQNTKKRQRMDDDDDDNHVEDSQVDEESEAAASLKTATEHPSQDSQELIWQSMYSLMELQRRKRHRNGKQSHITLYPK